MVSKRTMRIVGRIDGFPCATHPLRGSLDPTTGHWFAVGTETGHVHIYSLLSALDSSVPGSTTAIEQLRHGETSCAPAFVMTLGRLDADSDGCDHLPDSTVPRQTMRLPRARQSASASRNNDKCTRPVYCVAWNPRLHMMVATGRFDGGGARLLCAQTGAEASGCAIHCAFLCTCLLYFSAYAEAALDMQAR